MALPLIALAISAAGTAASGIMSANANRKRQAALDKENARQEAYYIAQLNKDPLNEFYNKNLIGTMQRTMRDRLAVAKARQKITGELDTTNVMRDQNAEAMSRLYGNILSNAAMRRDSIMNGFENAKRDIYKQRADIDAAKMQNYANLASNAASVGAAAIGGVKGVSPKAGVSKPMYGFESNNDYVKNNGMLL